MLALEGLLREFARKGNAFHDVIMMALLRKEWPPAQRLDRPGARWQAWRPAVNGWVNRPTGRDLFLTGDLAGGSLAPSVLGFFDELRMERQSHEKEGLVTCISDTS
jgi:hypothetical protein